MAALIISGIGPGCGTLGVEVSGWIGIGVVIGAFCTGVFLTTGVGTGDGVGDTVAVGLGDGSGDELGDGLED